MRTAIILALLLALFFGVLLGSRPLSVPDEGRYGEIPREMVESGDWLTPRLNGVEYFEKPPLVYWLTALSIKLFGLSEWSLRLVPALFALFGCLAVYLAGSRLSGPKAGLLSAAALAVSVLYYALSRLLSLDMPLSALLTASLLSFLLGVRGPAGGARRAYLFGFYAFSALAVLAKGLIGVLLPALVIGAWLLVMNNWKILKELYLPTGLLLFLLIAAPWHALMAHQHPEFARFYFVHEHFTRYLTTEHNRYKPFWYFAPVLLLALFPWTAFLVQAVRRGLPRSWKDRRESPETVFLLLWAAVIFLFFSASGSKLIPYVLPALPPLALLIGAYLADAWEGREVRGFRAGILAHAAVSLLVGLAFVLLPRYRPEAAGLRPLIYVPALVLVGAAAASLAGLRKPAPRRAIAVVATAAVVFLISTAVLAPALDSRSVKDLALKLKQRLQPGDEVACYRSYYRDLQVYLEKRLTLVGWKGELEFGMTSEDASEWMVNETEFWKRWQGRETIYLVAERRRYDSELKESGQAFRVVAESPHTLILSNRKGPS